MKYSGYILLFLLLPGITSARLLRPGYQGLRMLGMGDANIGLADDSNAVWYNPAGLAKRKGFHFNLIDLSTAADSLDTLDRLYAAVFRDQTSSLLRGDTQFTRLSTFPSVHLPNFTFGLYQLGNVFADIGNLNSLDAFVDIFSVSDSGLIMGFGVPLMKFISIGVSGRIFQRSAIDLYMTGTDLLERTGTDRSEFLEAVFDSVKGSSGLGWAMAANAGVLIEVPTKPNDPQIQLGATAEDIGMTSFHQYGRTPTPPAVPMSYHAGMGIKFPMKKKGWFNVALDVRDILGYRPWVKMGRLGLEFKHNRFGLRVGVMDGYPTYGASLEMFPHTRIHLASYAYELGEDYWTRSYRVYALQFVVGFNPF